MEELQKLIEEYGEYNSNVNRFKKLAEPLNKKIKTIMGQQNLDKFESDNFVATYTLRKKEEVDEDKLITLLYSEVGDEAKDLGIIKTKEYIDTDALERAIYKGDLDTGVVAKMANCKTVKRTPTLTITAIKEEK